jgi:hypothetical protein
MRPRAASPLSTDSSPGFRPVGTPSFNEHGDEVETQRQVNVCTIADDLRIEGLGSAFGQGQTKSWKPILNRPLAERKIVLRLSLYECTIVRRAEERNLSRLPSQFHHPFVGFGDLIQNLAPHPDRRIGVADRRHWLVARYELALPFRGGGMVDGHLAGRARENLDLCTKRILLPALNNCEGSGGVNKIARVISLRLESSC